MAHYKNSQCPCLLICISYTYSLATVCVYAKSSSASTEYFLFSLPYNKNAISSTSVAGFLFSKTQLLFNTLIEKSVF